MSGGFVIQMIWAIGILVLCISALASRRVPMKGALRIGLIWVAVFVGAYLVIRLVTELT